MARKKERSLKIQGYHRENEQVPELRLIGVWMEQLGFKVGDQVNITTRDRLLIIEPMQVAEPEQDYKAALQEVKQVLKKIS